MKKIRFALLSLLFTIILFAPFPKASATPAPSTSFILKQPDGATFRAYKRGDEYFHFTVDAEGRLIQKDKTGVWHYLKSSKNGLAFSGRADRYASPVDVTVDILSETDMKKAYVGLTGDTFVQVPRFINPPATLERIKKTQKLRQKKKSVDKQVSTLASIPIVMIVVGFRDCPYSDVYDWADKTFTGDYSVEKYYKDMSDNQFTFLPVEETSEYGSDGNTNINDAVNDGIIHVNLDIDHERWSELYSDEALTSLSNCLRKALTEASSYIDFSDYDADSDGYLSRTELALNFVIAGYDAASVPSDSNEEIYNQSIWPHQFDISHDPSDIPVLDGVEINKYTAIAEKNHILNTQNVFEIKQEMVGSLVHELAHILGLPDLYDTDINYDQALTKTKEWHSYSVNYLSLMASGNYAYDSEADEYCPTSLDAWSKYYLGWTKPTIINSSQSISLNSNKSGKYNTAKVQNLSLNNPDEYYILENRSFTGWDKSLAYMYKECSGGIVAWHVDNTVLENTLIPIL